jgi:hypothetical protein
MAGDERIRLRTGDLSWREVEGEAIILDLASQSYLSLNGTGLTLWQALEDGATAAELGERLIERHGATREEAARDVAAFVTDLRERNLLA